VLLLWLLHVIVATKIFFHSCKSFYQ